MMVHNKTFKNSDMKNPFLIFPSFVLKPEHHKDTRRPTDQGMAIRHRNVVTNNRNAESAFLSGCIFIIIYFQNFH